MVLHGFTKHSRGSLSETVITEKKKHADESRIRCVGLRMVLLYTYIYMNPWATAAGGFAKADVRTSARREL